MQHPQTQLRIQLHTYEVTTTSSGYTGGGNTLTNIDPTLATDTAVCDFCRHQLDISYFHCTRMYYFIILLLLQDLQLTDQFLLLILVAIKR